MRAGEFLAWMQATDSKNAADVMRKLDVGRNQAQRWVADANAGQDVDVKRVVALAMSALAVSLHPWPSTEDR